jgi:hypothetical protein
MQRRILFLGLAGLATVMVRVSILITPAHESGSPPPPNAEVRAICRDTDQPYAGESLGARLIACHAALGRPYPDCQVDPRKPYPGGLAIPGQDSGPALAYVHGEPPCVLNRS